MHGKRLLKILKKSSFLFLRVLTSSFSKHYDKANPLSIYTVVQVGKMSMGYGIIVISETYSFNTMQKLGIVH